MNKEIEARIPGAYELLSPSERKFAEVTLEHQKDFYSFTTTELAQRAGVSKATAGRFFKKLGYLYLSRCEAIDARKPSVSILSYVAARQKSGDVAPAQTSTSRQS